MTFRFIEQSSDDEEYQIANESKNIAINVSGNNESMETSVNWRDNLAQKARNAYLDRQSNTQNLMKTVYGAKNLVCGQLFLVFFILTSQIQFSFTVLAEKAE